MLDTCRPLNEFLNTRSAEGSLRNTCAALYAAVEGRHRGLLGVGRSAITTGADQVGAGDSFVLGISLRTFLAIVGVGAVVEEDHSVTVVGSRDHNGLCQGAVGDQGGDDAHVDIGWPGRG